MTNFIGMDTEAVSGYGTQLKAQSGHLEGIVTTVDSIMRQLLQTWEGSDARDFHQWWVGQHRPALQSAAHAVAGLGQSALNNASDQRHTSAAIGAAVGAAGALSATASGAASWSKMGPNQMLAFAKASYDGDASVLGWKALSKDQLKALGIDASSLHDRGTSLDASIYTDGHGHYVIAFAGSHDGRDWLENGKGLVGMPSGQTEGAANLASRLASRVGADHMMITGHSLGGRDAAVASIATGARAYTFNAAGVTDEDIVYAKELSGHHVSLGDYVVGKVTSGASLHDAESMSKVTNYVMANDPVTGGQIALPLVRDAYGTTVVDGVAPTLNPITAHGLDEFDNKLPN